MGSHDELVMPNTAEEVTLEWLQSIFNDKAISSFTITQKRLLETTSKLYITLDYEGDQTAVAASKPRHILLKGAFNPDVFAVPGYKSLLMRVFTREVNFFNSITTLSDSSGLEVPKVMWAEASEDQAILAMEDLEKAGASFGDPTRTYSVASAKGGVEQLAALHGHTWGWTTEQAPWLAVPLYEPTMRGLMGMWDELALGEGRPPLPAIMRDDRARTARALEAYFDTRNPRFRCLLHGDPHIGNTYFPNKDETKTRFLDWQIAHLGSGFHDVAYFVSGMLTVEDRRAHEWEIMDHYLAALARYGGPKLSRDDPEVVIEYRKAQITGLGWALTPYTMQKKERVIAIVERYAAAIVDHKTIEALTPEGTA